MSRITNLKQVAITSTFPIIGEMPLPPMEYGDAILEVIGGLSNAIAMEMTIIGSSISVKWRKPLFKRFRSKTRPLLLM